ncbi:MAG: crosslink repair DNA glycosylase YcaQ family protein [Ginsengibacter sp.]
MAIGVRLPGSTNKQIQTAIDKGQIIRTHLLRPTWHFVSPDDIYWILQLTAPQIRSSLKSREKELEITEPIFTTSNTVIQKALRDYKYLTREELMTELAKAKIATDNNRSSHLLLRAELEGIICNGATKGKTVLMPC